MTELIIVRHGETDWNREGRFQGHMQTQLNERGRQEAQLVAARLAEEEVDALYCSDLQRARETAWPIAEAMEMPIHLRRDLRERDVGETENLTLDEVTQAFPEYTQEWQADPIRTRPPDGESYADLHQRAQRVLDDLLAHHPEERVVIVSHGGTIKGLICAIAGLEPAARMRLHIGTASISVVRHDGNRGRIETISDVCHLDELRTIEYVLFDLDNTLYPKSAGVMERIAERILQFMEEELEIKADRVASLRQRYLERHGTTLRGLREDFDVDTDHYLAYVHDFPLEDHLEPDPGLNSALAGIEQEKILFTNATKEHARRVLSHLGIEEHFARIFDIEFLDHINKPDREAYRRVLAALDARGDECLLVDDLPANLRTSKDFGMVTVLVGKHGEEQADFAIESVRQLPQILEELGG